MLISISDEEDDDEVVNLEGKARQGKARQGK
jgi:hypothetical protein